MKKEILGYAKRDVEERIKEYEGVIDTQKRDIVYLKDDNTKLKEQLAKKSAAKQVKK